MPPHMNVEPPDFMLDSSRAEREKEILKKESDHHHLHRHHDRHCHRYRHCHSHPHRCLHCYPYRHCHVLLHVNIFPWSSSSSCQRCHHRLWNCQGHGHSYLSFLIAIVCITAFLTVIVTAIIIVLAIVTLVVIVMESLLHHPHHRCTSIAVGRSSILIGSRSP